MMCGPFMAATMNGIVRNGPTPTMLITLVAVACSRPISRSSVGPAEAAGADPRSVIRDQCVGERRQVIGRSAERIEGQRSQPVAARAAECRPHGRAFVFLHPRN